MKILCGRWILLIAVVGLLGTAGVGSAQVPPAPTTLVYVATAIDIKYARTSYFQSQSNTPLQVTLSAPAGSGYALQIHMVHVSCVQPVTFPIMDGTTVAFTVTTPYFHTPYYDGFNEFVWPGLQSTSGSFTMTVPACGAGNSSFLWLTYTP